MGEVYRARDTKLGRDVAIKILPVQFANDRDRVERFEREARALAALNHPNIANIYGLEQGAVVMELLEGETLRDRLKSGALPARKAIDVASQIARGLAAAHDRGIVHRDLKPENIFVLDDGREKILDFGLARQITPASGATETIARGTDPGIVMGTVGYMAPEQVKGQALDARADLFALGAVLHEMLTGHAAFKRETAAETMTAILKEDPPDLASNRADISPALDRIVRHCLEKNPIERFQTARDVAFALDALSSSTPTITATGSAPPVPAAAPWLRERIAWIAATLLLAAVAGWLALMPRSRPATQPAVAYRTILPLPDSVTLQSGVTTTRRLAICEDGRRIAFVGAVLQRLPAIWLESLIDSDARELKGTENMTGPSWSSDCTRLTVTSPATCKLLTLDIGGGTPVDFGPFGFALWGDRFFVTTVTAPVWAVRRVSEPGRPPVVLWKPTVPGETFSAQALLPDGRHVLLRHERPQATPRLEVASLEGGEPVSILEYRDLGNSRYANGAIVFSRADRVFAQPFDPDRMRLSGDPTLIADRVDTQVVGAAFAVSANGILVYAGGRETPRSRLTWIDRSGRTLATLGDDADYSNLELSPDGRRLAVSVPDASSGQRFDVTGAGFRRDIYVFDERGVAQRLTFDPSDERSAVWSQDGRQIIYTSKGLDLYRRPSDFTGAEEPLEVDHVSKDPRQVSTDGRLLLFRKSGGPTGNDIWIMPLDGDRKPQPILQTPFDENYAMFSPDDRSVVYVSDESGRPEVYVISREGGGGKKQVSTGGGTFPRWRDAKEILYLAAGSVADECGGYRIGQWVQRRNAEGPVQGINSTGARRAVRRDAGRSAVHPQHPGPIAPAALSQRCDELASVDVEAVELYHEDFASWCQRSRAGRGPRTICSRSSRRQ
jgi:hypothetical protein